MHLSKLFYAESMTFDNCLSNASLILLYKKNVTTKKCSINNPFQHLVLCICFFTLCKLYILYESYSIY